MSSLINFDSGKREKTDVMTVSRSTKYEETENDGDRFVGFNIYFSPIRGSCNWFIFEAAETEKKKMS